MSICLPDIVKTINEEVAELGYFPQSMAVIGIQLLLYLVSNFVRKNGVK